MAAIPTMNALTPVTTNPSLFCQGNGPQNSGQYDDGHYAFHYIGTTPATADSEYMTIRKASEPRPQ